MCPGKKDCVTVRTNGGDKLKMQKRLLLANLKEIYSMFQKENHEVKVGFSTFASLRPKWCILAGASGTHSVCVCTHHQNIKLMISAIDKDIDYKDLMSMCVCNVNNRDCMLHHCDICPESSILKSFLNKKIDEKETDTMEIKFKQWKNTDRSTLEDMEFEIDDFVDDLTEKCLKLTEHHFIADNQSQFFKQLKTSLTSNEAVFVLDFAENYSFLVQDAIQNFHWNNSQVTIHQIVIYYNDSVTQCTNHLCLAMISDQLLHDTVAVFAFQQVFVKELKEFLPLISKLFYVSDGSSAQYKNYKNFANLTYHKQDFGIDAEWHFFATSHGKNACDGVGGSLKRLAAKASLQRPIEDQILTPLQFYRFCAANVTGIRSFFVSSEDITSIGKTLEDRFTKFGTVKGTRSNHCFIPTTQMTLNISRISGEVITCNNKSTDSRFQSIEQISAGSYYACTYEKEWYIGLAQDVSK